MSYDLYDIVQISNLELNVVQPTNPRPILCVESLLSPYRISRSVLNNSIQTPNYEKIAHLPFDPAALDRCAIFPHPPPHLSFSRFSSLDIILCTIHFFLSFRINLNDFVSIWLLLQYACEMPCYSQSMPWSQLISLSTSNLHYKQAISWTLVLVRLKLTPFTDTSNFVSKNR